MFLRLVALLGLAFGASSALPAATPSVALANRCSGVTAADGRATGATFYRRMVGFAAEANTRGGLGQPQYLVWKTADDGTVGTLRQAVETAARGGGGWISFDPQLKQKTILLEAPLRLGSDLTIDGGCAAPRLIGAGRGSLMYLRGVSNVVIARLQMEHAGGGEDGDCVTVSHGADRVWVAHNRIRACRDGLVDVTRNGGRPMRVTVSGNWFADQDKSVLVDGGPGTTTCDPGGVGVRLTLFRNRFVRTGQRHPRAAGSVFVHAAQNEVSFSPRLRSDGSSGAAYGIYASAGARVLAEDVTFMPQGARALRIGSTPPEEAAAPSCQAGAIRIVRGSTTKGEARSVRATEVANAPYSLPAAPANGARGLADLLDRQSGPAVD